jgi:D-alanine--poly(phosphoribitol) ligase subunit 1
VFDFYSALFSGAAIAPINKELLSQPLALLDLIDELACTIWFSVPSMLIYMLTMKAFHKGRFQSIRSVIFGGEGFPKSELVKLYDLFADHIEFVNVYGPTEGTCICSSYTIQASDFANLEGLPTLGTINCNFDYLILDELGRKSDRGELCILGPNIGLGYYRDMERSKAVFLDYSGYGFYNDRMYKTGDMVHEWNGLLYFLGRKDNQIKHMGYRIELEEIELALNALSNVNQAAVIYERVNAGYGKIIAFVASEMALESAELKKELTKKLPDYMIPNVIKVGQELPKNPNGKVDRNKLREIFRAIESSKQAA